MYLKNLLFAVLFAVCACPALATDTSVRLEVQGDSVKAYQYRVDVEKKWTGVFPSNLPGACRAQIVQQPETAATCDSDKTLTKVHLSFQTWPWPVSAVEKWTAYAVEVNPDGLSVTSAPQQDDIPIPDKYFSVFWVYLPAALMISMAVIHGLYYSNRVHLLRCYSVIIASVLIGAGCGLFIGPIAGMLVGAFIGIVTGGMASGMAGALAGEMASANAGMLAGQIGWANAAMNEYLVFLVLACAAGVAVREIAAALKHWWTARVAAKQ